MPKAPHAAGDSGEGQPIRRTIPSVEAILSSPAIAPVIEEHGRASVKTGLAAELDLLRAANQPYDSVALAASLAKRLASETRSTLRRVINATGILIHTNLGRCPIDVRLWREAEEIAAGYSNLEFDLETGERGSRDEHLAAICRTLFGCEAAVLANNNAAATLLLLAALAPGKEVLVSRGELVEIGGAFRVPEVIAQGGAKLREVGTTNRTRASDYASATTRRTAAILRVHRSNFEIVGFTETPEIAELVDVARKKKIPLLFDEGSGRVVDLAPYGFSPRPTVRELLADGVDVVTCSTDKLIGATQGGLILGSRELVDRCRRHPMMRALRAGKESYALIAATLRAFAAGKQEDRVAIYRMLAMPLDALRARAMELIADLPHRIVETRCALGGGTTPTETIPSIGLELAGNANEMRARLLTNEIPIVGRIENDRFLLDVRTLLDDDLAAVRDVLRTA